jgi:folate-dependent phosphoribosylglycinamide formyltransferase PurN
MSGCTVQFVAASVMAGIVIAQSAVPVLDHDDEESLRLRVLAEENQLLPAVVRAIAERRVIVEDRRALVIGAVPSGYAPPQLVTAPLPRSGKQST